MNLNDALDLDLDSIDDLPPVGVPPTGHYNLDVTASLECAESGTEYVKFSFVVTAVNEVVDPTEADQVQEGMKFSESFFPVKKDGTRNDFSLSLLKAMLAPFAEHFGTTKLSETLAAVDGVSIAASVRRVKDKRDKERFNARISEIVVL